MKAFSTTEILSALILLALALLVLIGFGASNIEGAALDNVSTTTTPTWTEADPFYSVLLMSGLKFETGRPTKGDTIVEVVDVSPHWTGEAAPNMERTESTFTIAVTTYYTVPLAFIPQQ